METHDEIINQVDFSIPKEDSLETILVISPEDYWIVSSIFQPISWHALQYCAESVAQCHGFSVEEFGFEYPTDLDPDEEMFEGVRLFAFDDNLFVSAKAFDNLMLRYFDKMIEIAELRNPSIITETWWPVYLENVNVIRERVGT